VAEIVGTHAVLRDNPQVVEGRPSARLADKGVRKLTKGGSQRKKQQLRRIKD